MIEKTRKLCVITSNTHYGRMQCTVISRTGNSINNCILTIQSENIDKFMAGRTIYRIMN